MATEGWVRVPIKTAYVGLYDGPHATPKPSDTGPVFLGIKNITDDGQLDLSDIRHISEDEFPKWTRRVTPRPGDIVFTYEATLNRYAIIPEGFRGCLGRRLALIRPDPSKVETRFLHYYFFGDDWRRTVSENILSGSTVDRIPLTNFPEFEISLPDRVSQRKIAAVLSAYDDLIENNARRIQILEEMAQLIYREWFVHFRFPGHEDVEMVEVEGYGLAPAGWRLVRLAEVADVNALSIRKGSGPQRIGYINISSVSTGSVDQVEYMDFADAPSRARRVVRHGDIIWSTVRPNRKSYSLIVNPDSNTIASTGFVVISARSLPFTYLYYALTTEDFVSYLTNRATGSAYPAVNQNDFNRASVLLPGSDVSDKYHALAADLVELKHRLLRKNAVLRQIRDLLLPRLISGELDVSGLEIAV